MLEQTVNTDMRLLSSMKTGGVAKRLFLPENIEELSEIIKKLNKNQEKFVVLGNISNVLLPDEEMDFPIIVTTRMNKIEMMGDDRVFAMCGAPLTSLSMNMCKRGLSGIEFAYGIPGSVGGAVYMNAGAYGGEISHVLDSVTALDKNGESIILSNEECEFSYRHSAFSENGLVIAGATFKFEKENFETCVATAKEFMKSRADKQPLEYPSCGSAFKRPEGNFAGALIERANLKGKSVCGACVSEKHAGFVVNKGGAKSEDVISLMRYVREKVYAESGIMLEAEIKFLGKDGEFFSL